MEILVAMVLLFYAVILTMRMLVPGRAGDVFFGILARDFFWLFLRGLGVLICLPLQILKWLLHGGTSRANRPRRRGRRRRHFVKRGRWGTSL